MPNATSVSKDPDVAKHCLLYMTNMLSYQQRKPKTTFYMQCLLSEIDVENNNSDKTYIATTLSKEEIVENHKSVLSSFGLYQGR